MSSEVEICNIALTHIKAPVIQTLNEPNESSRKCKLMYPISRDAVLRDHDWGFARKTELLAQLVETFTNWDYAYGYPTDCLQARKILDPTGANTGTSYDIDADRLVQVGKVQFEVISNSAGDNRILVTNKESAELQYTKGITDTNMFDSLFIEMLGVKLAANLAIPLTGKAPLLDAYNRLYRQMLESAKSTNANEGYTEPDNVNVFLNSRN
jgi:hypothetical protein